MNLKMKLGAVFFTAAQVMSVAAQTQNVEAKKADVQPMDIAKLAAGCSALLSTVQSKSVNLPKYKTPEVNSAYEYFYLLGQKQVGVTPFFQMVEQKAGPIAHDLGEADGFRKEIPAYEVKYQIMISQISTGADKCISVHKNIQSRAPK